MENKETIKKLYNEYKKEYLNELYDTPLKFKKEGINKYIVYKENGEELAYFLFSFMYDMNKSPIDYKKYALDKYWNIDWYWSKISTEEKNNLNFLKVTSTSFKIVFDFIKENNYPVLLAFGGQYETHEKVYSNKNFLDRWGVLLGEKYYVEWLNDKFWIINKNFHKIDENRIIKFSQFQEKPPSEIYRDMKFPTKNKLKGISRHDFIKEQIRRIILKQIYLK